MERIGDVDATDGPRLATASPTKPVLLKALFQSQIVMLPLEVLMKVFVS